MKNNKAIQKLFNEYRRKIKNTWEEYLLLHYSLSVLKTSHKKKSIGIQFKRELLTENVKMDYKDRDIHNFIENIKNNKLNYKTLIEAVSLTETFLQDLTVLVYRDFPLKVAHKSTDSLASELKLTQLIVSSADKNEMIEALIEEKVRSIFYGKPADIFIKDKCKIGFGDFFVSNFQNAILEFNEILARRNIFIHNNGMVDSKYLREVESTTLKKGQTPKINKAYINHAIVVLRGLSALSTKLVLQNIYKIDVSRRRVTKIAKTLDEYLK